jgi:hypothetical protein
MANRLWEQSRSRISSQRENAPSYFVDIFKLKASKDMGYSYIEGNKYLGHGPNISGMGFLIKAIKEAGGDICPSLNELMSTGEGNAQAVKGEAERLAEKVKAKNVKHMLGLLACAAAQAKKIITIE